MRGEGLGAARGGQDADRRLGHPEPGGGVGDAEVAVQGELQAGADRVAVEGGDGRDRQASQRRRDVALEADPAGLEGRRGRAELAQVGTRAECPPGAADDEDAQLVVAGDPPSSSCSSSRIRTEQAFRTSGRSSVIVPTVASRSKRIVS